MVMSTPHHHYVDAAWRTRKAVDVVDIVDANGCA